jgi:hypothetical protein
MFEVVEMKHGYMHHKGTCSLSGKIQGREPNLLNTMDADQWEEKEKVSIDEAKNRVDSVPPNVLLASGKTWR